MEETKLCHELTPLIYFELKNLQVYFEYQTFIHFSLVLLMLLHVHNYLELLANS